MNNLNIYKVDHKPIMILNDVFICKNDHPAISNMMKSHN